MNSLTNEMTIIEKTAVKASYKSFNSSPGNSISGNEILWLKQKLRKNFVQICLITHVSHSGP